MFLQLFRSRSTCSYMSPVQCNCCVKKSFQQVGYGGDLCSRTFTISRFFTFRCGWKSPSIEGEASQLTANTLQLRHTPNPNHWTNVTSVDIFSPEQTIWALTWKVTMLPHPAPNQTRSNYRTHPIPNPQPLQKRPNQSVTESALCAIVVCH